MIAMIWRFLVAVLDWRTIWRKLNGQLVADVAFGMNTRGDFGYFHFNGFVNFVNNVVLERPPARTVNRIETEVNSVEVVRLNADGFERAHRIFWFIFEWTLAQILAWWIQRKSIRLIKKNLSEQELESWKTVEGRRQILAECRRNFGKKRIAELFELRTRLFNWSSPLLQHFCRHVANAPALDDVYNATSSFSFNRQTVWPESAKPDVFSRFFLSCPNGQAVRNRYRTVVGLCKETGGGDRLSIASGSAQPLIHANYELQRQGRGDTELLLTDIDDAPLALAKRRTEQAGISDRVSFLQASFKCLPKRLAGKKYDVVEACGIFDYLSDKQSLFLLDLMLRFLRPGGKIIISGMAETRGADLLRKIYNWEIIYRSPNEFADLVKMAGGKNVKIYIEPWGIQYVAVATY